MKILTGAEMREVDRKAIEAGVPSLVLMENAGLRVVEFLAERFAPLAAQRIVIFCGKGNNGGDGLVVARQLLTRFAPASLDVIVADEPATADAIANLKAWKAVGGEVTTDVTPRMRAATLIVDALLGTGATGAPQGRTAELIGEINTGFPAAKTVAIDVPSGIGFGGVRAAATVTFESYKREHFDFAEEAGEVVVRPIGLPGKLINDPAHWYATADPDQFRGLFAPRQRDSHKGNFGHVLVVGGATGTTGAAIMAGMAALRAGAGLVTVSAATQQGFPPELMTAALSHDTHDDAIQGKTALAIGPGLGATAESKALVRRLVSKVQVPVVLDADALNVLGDARVHGCVLTPHPGEMARLAGLSTAQVQADRLGVARGFATERGAIVVLKGAGTLIAFPDGTIWRNTTGNPGMATGGAGDILTGLIAGLVAQFPTRLGEAVLAAVWLHGRAGDLGVQELGEKSLIATDLLRFLPAAMGECSRA